MKSQYNQPPPTTVVKEGNLGHRQKCPRLPSLEPNCPPFALHGGQRGTILAKWGHITLLEGDLGQTSRTRKEGGGEAIFDSREGSIAPFCWIESRSFRLVLCGLRFFCSDFRLAQANGVVDLDFFTVILDLSRVDLDFFAGFVGRRGGSKFGLREGKLAPFWRRGGGVSNEGLLDLMSVDLVFFWIESRHFRQNRLVLCGLRLFCWICRQTGCGLRLFCSEPVC